MKSNQKLSHVDLFTQVMGVCKFSMTNTDVKKRIEQLIEREYIKKCENEDAYEYIA